MDMVARSQYRLRYNVHMKQALTNSKTFRSCDVLEQSGITALFPALFPKKM